MKRGRQRLARLQTPSGLGEMFADRRRSRITLVVSGR